MTTEEKARMLNHLYSRLTGPRLNLIAWMRSVYNTLVNLYGKESPEALQFSSMVSDYESAMEKFNGYSKTAYESNFKVKSRKYLWGLIQELDSQTVSMHPSNETQYVQRKTIQAQTKSVKVNSRDKQHYVIGIGIFWTVVTFAVPGLLTLGYQAGSTIFDKEKIDMAEDLQQLKKDTIQLRKEMAVKQDSLTEYNKRVNQLEKEKQSLLYYIGTLENKNPK